MIWKLSVKDISFICPFYNYLSFFLITSWYDFEKNSVHKSRRSKFYGGFLILVKIVWFIFTYTDETFKKIDGALFFTQKVIYIGIQLNLEALLLLTVVKSSFFDAEDWKTLFSNFQLVDTKLQNRGRVNLKISQNFYVGLFVKHLVFALFGALFIMGGFIQLYYEFLIIILLRSLVEGLKNRYEDLNDRLLRISKRPNILHELSSIAHSYRILGENVEICNKLFGYQVLLIIFHCGFQMVHCLNFTFVSFIFNSNLYSHGLTSGILMLIVITGNVLSIILPIDSTVQKAKQFIDLCYKMQEKFTCESEETSVLTKLANDSKNYTRDFSAAGFFTINKSIIFSMVGTVTTYFIITIQLNESQYKKIS
ncbi:hypothetical protein MTP99_000093 [Tenebrio molitor]|nr:hypothetical protein MTP99_000093 [Tenebrio molitor]